VVNVTKGLNAGPYEVMFFMALKEGPAYGYELARRFNKMTRGHLKISYGTIYPFLRRMQKRRLIRSKGVGSSGRIYYELTELGIVRQKAVFDEIMKVRKPWEEKLLGILAMHAAIFGEDRLDVLFEGSRWRA
jgi:DNA-binding PadR family transcriptional regulator